MHWSMSRSVAIVVSWLCSHTYTYSIDCGLHKTQYDFLLSLWYHQLALLISNFLAFHSVCLELHTCNFLHTINQPVMSTQGQPCSAGASGSAIQQQPPLYPTPQQNVVTSAPKVFCHSGPGVHVQPQLLSYQEQPATTFAHPYVVCLQVLFWNKYLLCSKLDEPGPPWPIFGYATGSASCPL